jgi:pimeloyl-ACP methyl ester carboxylesterase
MKRLLKIIGSLLICIILGSVVAGYTPDSEPDLMKKKYAGTSSAFITADGDLNIHIRDQGKRESAAIVMLHGSNASLHTWEPWVKALSKDYRLISIDLPGHGLTGANPRGAYDYDTYINVVHHVVEKLDLRKFILVGHSMGGEISWRYNLKHPQKVSGLVLIASAGSAEPKQKNLPAAMRISQIPFLQKIPEVITPRKVYELSLKEFFSNYSIIDDDMVDRYWELNRYPGNREATTARLSTPSNFVAATTQQLALIKTPSLIMWGSDDRISPLISGKWFQSSLAQSTLIVYPNTGHIPMEESPEKTSNDLRSWINQIPK